MLSRCRKFLALITLVAGLVHSSQLLALGLGDLTVNSSLNEPLEATIELLGLDGLTSGQIQARLGSVDEFERANINRDFLIDDIQLEIIIFNSEQGILRLTSEEPVIEPFLSMVINVGWPTGRLMRDYTALIDLPVFVSDEPQVVPLDVPQTPAPVREETPPPAPEPEAEIISNAEPIAPAVEDITEPAPAEPAQEIAEQENEEPEAAQSNTESLAEQDAAELMVAEEPEPVADTGVTEVSEEVAAVEEPAESEQPATVTVESGDTLYDIAANNRPATSVSVEQTMLAIQRANPQAFIDNNINMIRVGQVLRIPSIQQVQSIDQAQALNQIALQNQAVSVQPLDFSANNAANSADSTDELTILSGEDGTDSLSGDNDMAETIAALENQLAISEENLDRARLENAELTARFNELSEQVDILQNIIAMQDERLAQLQADLTARNAEAALATAQPMVDTPAQPPQADNSIMGKLSSVFENTLVLVSSLLALILLVVGFLVWRRRAAQDAMDDFGMAETAMAGNATRAIDIDEPEGASAGFLAALKARMSRNNTEDDYAEEIDESDQAELIDADSDEADVEESDFEPAGLAAIEESDALDALEEELEDDIDDIDEVEEESTGLLGKLKGLFRRSSDDEDEADEADIDQFYDDSEDLEDDIDDDDDTDESSYAEEDDADDDDEFSDLIIDDFDDDEADSHEDSGEDTNEGSQELVAESADALLDKFLDDVDLDETDSAEADGDTETEALEESGQDTPANDDVTFDLGDFDASEELQREEGVVAPEQANVESLVDNMADSDSEDVFEVEDDAFDLGNFTLDDADNDKHQGDSEDSAESTAKTESNELEEQAEVTLAEDSPRDIEDDSNALKFGLDPATTGTQDEVVAVTEAAEDVETFDFSLDDKTPDESTSPAEEEESPADLESFDFKIDDAAQSPESTDDNGQSESGDEDGDGDVETFDFDVSSVSSFAESSKPESFDADAPVLKDEVKDDDVETFNFDLGDVSVDDEQDAPVLESDDDIVIEEPESDDHSLESLAAALGQVDAGDSDDDSDTAVTDDNEFDLGEIHLDDSLFEIDDEDDAQETGDEPISDRDEASTKLDLAVAYEAMGDLDGAKEILSEVVAEGNAEQIAEATKLLQKWSDS